MGALKEKYRIKFLHVRYGRGAFMKSSFLELKSLVGGFQQTGRGQPFEAQFSHNSRPQFKPKHELIEYPKRTIIIQDNQQNN